jgi:hypothetical protein
MTLRVDIQHNSIECHYAKCRDYLNVNPGIIMLSVIILNVVMLSVIGPILKINDSILKQSTLYKYIQLAEIYIRL